MTRVGLHYELLAGHFGGAIYAKRLGAVPFLIRVVSLPILASEDVVCRVEHYAASIVGSSSGYIERFYGVHSKRQRRVELTIVYPVEGGRVEHPSGFTECMADATLASSVTSRS